MLDVEAVAANGLRGATVLTTVAGAVLDEGTHGRRGETPTSLHGGGSLVRFCERTAVARKVTCIRNGELLGFMDPFAEFLALRIAQPALVVLVHQLIQPPLLRG